LKTIETSKFKIQLLAILYFSKKVHTVNNGVSWGVFQNFGVKITVTVGKVSLLLTVSYKKLGQQDVPVAPPIILLGETKMVPLLPRFPRLRIAQS